MKLNWGKSIFLFILLFLTLCTVVIIFSLRQNHDLVTDNYYDEGAAYTTKLEEIQRSEVYIDSISLMQHSDRIVVFFSEGLKTDNEEIQLWFYRPSGKNSDHKAKYSIMSDSVTVKREDLIRGRYILKISWIKDSLAYTIEKDIFIN